MWCSSTSWLTPENQEVKKKKPKPKAMEFYALIKTSCVTPKIRMLITCVSSASVTLRNLIHHLHSFFNVFVRPHAQTSAAPLPTSH